MSNTFTQHPMRHVGEDVGLGDEAVAGGGRGDRSNGTLGGGQRGRHRCFKNDCYVFFLLKVGY